jgi:RNA polymerase sigma-70 factor, ECF subfamily
MKHKLVRYKVKPEAAAENRRLIETVFGALQARSPEDISYMVLELEDGSFVHLKTDFREGAFDLGELPAFQAFSSGIASAATSRRKPAPRASSDAIRLPIDEVRVTESAASAGGGAEFERLIGELRPKLHRYAARMTGSAIDGEDVVQEALAKAVEAFSREGGIAQPQALLFRIAHNEAIDFLRRRARHDAVRTDEDPDVIVDPEPTPEERAAAATSLRTFARLPVVQRSAVILMDVLGYSIEEIGGIIAASVPAVKAALHRGRTRLRELAGEPDDRPLPALSAPERARLAAYADRFNARDFDAVRDMLAEDVRLELVARTRMRGSEVRNYFGNYASIDDWRFVPGQVDGRPAILVYDPNEPEARPTYFVLLEWDGGKLVAIRDFRYARYAVEDAEVVAAS